MATYMNQNTEINKKLDLILKQTQANANGISQLASCLGTHHTQMETQLSDLRVALEETHEDVSTTVMNEVDTHEMLHEYDSDAKAERRGISFTQKLTLGVELLMVIGLIFLTVFVWKTTKIVKESKQKDEVISWYQQVIEEYGIELPAMPEFPEMHITTPEESNEEKKPAPIEEPVEVDPEEIPDEEFPPEDEPLEMIIPEI